MILSAWLLVAAMLWMIGAMRTLCKKRVVHRVPSKNWVFGLIGVGVMVGCLKANPAGTIRVLGTGVGVTLCSIAYLLAYEGFSGQLVRDKEKRIVVFSTWAGILASALAAKAHFFPSPL